MIFTNSRYVNAAILSAQTEKGDSVTAVYAPRTSIQKLVAYTEYVIVDDDRLDRLAAQFYGDATQWWRIAQANPEIFYPDGDLPTGSVLRIPRADSLRTV